jgi:DNA-binding NarL/FixJ family response regulator
VLTTTIKVLLIDDHPLVLDSLRQLLDPHVTVVGTVHNPEDIITRALEHSPDVILLDACMPGLGGFEATRQLKKLLPSVKVILVTMLTEAISVSEALRAGASGYVLKQSASEELLEAIESVLVDKRFLSKQIDAEVRDAFNTNGLDRRVLRAISPTATGDPHLTGGGPDGEANCAAT